MWECKGFLVGREGAWEVLPKPKLTFLGDCSQRNPLTNVYLVKPQRTHKIQEQVGQEKKFNNIQERKRFSETEGKQQQWVRPLLHTSFHMYGSSMNTFITFIFPSHHPTGPLHLIYFHCTYY